MHYLDTSVVAAILLDDPERDRAERLLESLRGMPKCLSHWTGVEVFSAIAKRIRTREATERRAIQARQLYLDEFAGKLIVWNVGVREFERARLLLSMRGTNLRGGDALHLAVALNNGASGLFTFDEILRKAAVLSGLAAPRI